MSADPTPPHFPDPPSRAPAVLYWAAACVLVFGSLGARDLWKSEARWGQVTREMLRSGDYFHPTINGDPYFDKPLLGYWLIAATAKLSGGLSEWAVRFPSAVAGLVALAATISLGRRLWSEQVARTAGWLLLTTYGFLFYARLGMADMENLAAIVLAVAWYAARRDRPGFVTYLVFYLVCFVGAQTKGLTAVIVPLLVIGPDLVRGRGAGVRRHVNVAHALAGIIGAAVYLLPFVYASKTADGYSVEGLRLVFQENIQRFTDAFDHDEPWFAYFYHLPTLMLPWTPLLAIAFGGFASDALRVPRRLPDSSRWMAWAILLIFVFFTASKSRRIYYLLPILPFCVLLISDWLHRAAAERPTAAGLALQRWLAIATALLSIATLPAWPALKSRYGFDPPRLLVISTPIIGAVALAAVLAGRRASRAIGLDPRLAPAAIGTAALLGGFFAAQFPTFDAFRQERPFASRLNELTRSVPDARVAYFHRIPETLIFYLAWSKPIERLHNTETIEQFLRGPGTKVLITQHEYTRRLRRMGVPGAALDSPAIAAAEIPWQPDDPDRLMACVIQPQP